MTLTLFFEPLDALFFRDHRPFHAARNFEAFSRFPSPTVFWGCLRTALLRADDRGWFAARPSRSQVDDALGPFELKLRGPTFACRSPKSVEPLLPYPIGGYLPRVVQPRPSGLLTPVHLDFRNGGTRQTQDRLPNLPSGKPKDRGLLTAPGIVAALAGQPPTGDLPRKKVYEPEPRFGIARDPQRRSVRDGLFYSLEYWRFAHPFGFAVELETTQPDEVRRRLDGRNVTLGGKGGRATVYVHDGGYLPKAPTTGARAFYWLLAPLPVSATLPPGLVSRVTETKGLPEGGFDLAERSPKPLVAVYPAGTLFFTDQPPVALTHIDNPLACTGLGSTLVGTW